MNTQIKYPEQVIVCKIKNNYKTRVVWASFDGVDRFEIYKHKDESGWLGTIYLNSMKGEYFWTKYAPKPDVSTYKYYIPQLKMTIDKIKLVKVKWIN